MVRFELTLDSPSSCCLCQLGYTPLYCTGRSRTFNTRTALPVLCRWSYSATLLFRGYRPAFRRTRVIFRMALTFNDSPENQTPTRNVKRASRPSEIRTHTDWFLRPMPLPLGYRPRWWCRLRVHAPVTLGSVLRSLPALQQVTVLNALLTSVGPQPTATSDSPTYGLRLCLSL